MGELPVETELKVPVADHAAVIERLKRLGAIRETGPAAEHNVLFDTVDNRLSRTGAIVRLRRYGPRWVLTFKGPAAYDGNVKCREERETAVEDGSELAVILARLGLEPKIRYEKIREVWRATDIEVALDSTPMGCFVELEGAASVLEARARELGLDPSRAVRGSYVSLWEQYRASHPELGLPRDMVFAE